MPLETVSVIGGGSWGTALAQAAAMAGRKVLLVARDKAQVEEINASRTNSRYLGSQQLHSAITAATRAETADIIILAGLFHPERYTEETALDPHQLVGDLGAAGRRAEYIPATDDIVARIIPDLRSGDVVLVMSNGAFGGIHQKLLGALQDRVVSPGA